MPGTPELLVILAVVLLLFGGAKLPGLARSMGQAKREFEQATDKGEGDGDKAHPESTKPSV